MPSFISDPGVGEPGYLIPGYAPSTSGPVQVNVVPTIPNMTVEIAFGYGPLATSPAWVDVTSYVDASAGISIKRGRSYALESVQPSTLALTLLNNDGRFTPGNTSSPYGSSAIAVNTPIRVTAVWNGVSYRRFTGLIDQWPQSWDGGILSRVQITATDVFKVLSRISLHSVLRNEILLDDPTWYFPLDEPSNSTTFNDASGNSEHPIIAKSGVAGQSPNFSTGATDVAIFGDPGGYVTFGNTGNNLDGDPITVLDFSPLNGWSRTPGVDFNTQVAQTWEVLFNATTLPAVLMYAMTMSDNTVAGIALGMNSDGTMTANVNSTTGGAFATSGKAYNDGKWHHAAATFDPTNKRSTLFIDGVQVASATGGTFWNPSPTYVQLGGVVNGSTASGGWTGSLAHVALYPGILTPARIAAHASAALAGLPQRSDKRIASLASYGGVPSSMVTTETGQSTLCIQDTAGVTLQEALANATASEQGVCYISTEGQIAFQSRTHRWNQASSFTADITQVTVAEDIVFSIDDQLVMNDITMSRPNGGTVRVTDQTSITQYGTHSNSNDQVMLLTTDAELTDAANYRLSYYKQPQVRTPAITFEPSTTTSLFPSLLGADISTRFTLASLPTEAPPVTDFVIESITETITPSGGYIYSVETSPADLTAYWTLDDNTYGLLDQDYLAY